MLIAFRSYIYIYILLENGICRGIFVYMPIFSDNLSWIHNIYIYIYINIYKYIADIVPYILFL